MTCSYNFVLSIRWHLFFISVFRVQPSSIGASANNASVEMLVHCDGASQSLNVPRAWSLETLRGALEIFFGKKHGYVRSCSQTERERNIDKNVDIFF